MIKDVIFIEDGSVDIDELKSKLTEETLIITYRQGCLAPVIKHLEKPIKQKKLFRVKQTKKKINQIIKMSEKQK